MAICFRVGWPDEQILLVPLTEMARASEDEKLVRTTLYIISPALKGCQGEGERQTKVRSRLYNPTHDHLFRPKPKQDISEE